MKSILKLFFVITCLFSWSVTTAQQVELNISAYHELVEGEDIYPNKQQLEMLEEVMPDHAFQPVPAISDRKYWDERAASESGIEYFEEALSLLDREPEVPISDEIYRRANKEGNRRIYKPRYYRTMDRLEKYIVAECMEDNGRFLPQIEVYSRAIMEMKSWMHPNHDDKENSVLEGKRVAIDLGARKFGLVLALADALLQDKLSDELRSEIATQLQWRIMDSYFKSCKGDDTKGNHWIRSTSNWNSVCTSGTVFTTIVASQNADERVAAIGCALNSMRYYLSGFGEDGYCSEGVGYWNYGFGHYLYLAEILYDYSEGKINLFEFDNPEKLHKVANFPEMIQIQNGLYPRFSDSGLRVSAKGDNFAYYMAAKYYGAQKPSSFIPDEAVQMLINWSDSTSYLANNEKSRSMTGVTYFDDYGVIISRGEQEVPFSIAIKAGHNAENHNHSDVGSYVIVLGDDMITGDIGAPSYTAGAFSDDNPARSSWGHPVPRIENKLQSNGKSFRGKVTEKAFESGSDMAVLDIKAAYEIPALEKLTRTMENDKSGDGTISITDEFSASKPIEFGTSIMVVDVAYEIVNENQIIFQSENQKVEVKIMADGGTIKLTDEVVPVEHLRGGKKAFRIGIDFTKPLSKGIITVQYKPLPAN